MHAHTPTHTHANMHALTHTHTQGSGAMNALGRNPEARDAIAPNMILALAFTEAIGIYGLVIAILLIFVA